MATVTLGSSPAIQTILPDYFFADPNAAADMNITVNVNGALATQAEIADGVYQALRTAQDLNGPLQLSIA